MNERRYKKSLKQVCFEVPESIHTLIKKRALDYNIPTRSWMLMAVMERLERERELGHEYPGGGSA